MTCYSCAPEGARFDLHKMLSKSSSLTSKVHFPQQQKSAHLFITILTQDRLGASQIILTFFNWISEFYQLLFLK